MKLPWVLHQALVRQFAMEMAAVKLSTLFNMPTAAGKKAGEHASQLDMAEPVRFKNTAGLATM